MCGRRVCVCLRKKECERYCATCAHRETVIPSKKNIPPELNVIELFMPVIYEFSLKARLE
jgi:hypothetical protein